MNQVSEKYKVFPPRSDEGSHTDLKSNQDQPFSRDGAKHLKSQLFLSEDELERIKERIRRKHHTDITKLLVLYGILLIILISYFTYIDVFS